MASCQTERWVSTSPYVKLTVTQSASTDVDVTLSWTLQYISDYAANTNGAGRAFTVKIGGSTVKEGTYNIDGVTGTKTIASGTKTISKTTAAQTVAFSVSFAFSLTWSGSYKNTLSASGTIGVPAKTSYKVSYNANGGSGAPAAQTKWHGTTLTLSTSKPSRTGYAFQGWATSASGSVAYAAGASYSANAAVTLYAIWKANTYTVSYNANGGSGAPAAQTKTYGTSLTLSSTKPTRTNYTFKGWGTSASATTVSYAPGASYTANAATTLYAVWELAYTKPRITSVSVNRCDSEGIGSDTGTYALVKFAWASDAAVTKITIDWVSSADSGTKTVSTSGTSGTVREIVGSGNISTELTYTVIITVTDSSGKNNTSRTLAGMLFPIDVLAEGKGVSFGKPAEKVGYADFGFNLHVNNGKALCSTDPSGNIKEILAPQNGSGNTVIGYGNYTAGQGDTGLYGHDIFLGLSNIAEKGSFRPYRRRGDTVSFTLRTAGYVTNGGADVTFLVPFAVPIVGSPTATVASSSGFVLRQGAKYTHGSSSDSYVTPSSYTAYVSTYCGVYVVAKFADTTNVTNNDSIGIYWSGTITFS